MNKSGATYDLIVIGGGPSGMMCAGRAAELGARVLLLEKNPMLGKKLSITGGGRCNITNAEFNVRAFLEHFPDSKEYLFSPFSKFSAKDAIAFFKKRGLSIKVEDRKRAFPQTNSAPDVVRVMGRYVRDHGVTVVLNSAVASLVKESDGSYTVRTKQGVMYRTRAVAVATGGLAAPETGSTGDGFLFLKKLGHTVIRPNPNIVPLTTNAPWVHALAGTTLPAVGIRFLQSGKVALRRKGKILLTHFGISGPTVLNASSTVRKLLDQGAVTASLDLFPEDDDAALSTRLMELFEHNKNKLLKNTLDEVVPAALARTTLTLIHDDLLEKKVHSVTKEERQALVHILKHLTFPITGTLGFDKAVIADGGVELDEVDFKTMESRLHPGLYLLGDVLNINRPSGGFSLQLCWTTGFVAGTKTGNNYQKGS